MFEQFLHNVFLLFDSTSRLFYVSILGSCALLLGYFLVKEGKAAFASLSRVLLNRKYWWNRSTQVDYQIFIVNAGIKSLFFGPLLGLSYYFSSKTIHILHALTGEFGHLESRWIYFVIATIFAFVLDDFLRFAHHVLMHKVPFLWELHKTHHSAKILTPVTLYRIHPIESAMATVRNSLSYGISAGVFMYVFSGQVELVTLFGVNAFGFLLNVVSGNIRHSHVPISFGPLERLFISPKQHQIHHSQNPRHWGKNYGVNLAIWDLLAGSLLLSTKETVISFGIQGGKAYSLIKQFFPRKWAHE